MCTVFWTVAYFWLGIGYFWIRKELKAAESCGELLRFLLLVWVWPGHFLLRVIFWAKSTEGREDNRNPPS